MEATLRTTTDKRFKVIIKNEATFRRSLTHHQSNISQMNN